MALERRNILLGAGRLFITTNAWEDDLNDFLPPPFEHGVDYLTTLAGSDDWNEIGYTSDGVEVAYTPEVMDVEVDQVKGAIRSFNTGLGVTINTTLAEATLENLMIAWNIGAENLFGQTYAEEDTTSGGDADTDVAGALPDALERRMDFVVPEDELFERSLIIVGNAPRRPVARSADAGDDLTNAPNQRVYYARRVVSVEASNHTLRRNEVTMFPVTFRLFPEIQTVGGQGALFGWVRDRYVGPMPTP